MFTRWLLCLILCAPLSAADWCAPTLGRVSEHSFALGIGDRVMLSGPQGEPTESYFLGSGKIPEAEGEYLLFLSKGTGALTAVAVADVEVKPTDGRVRTQVLLAVSRQSEADCAVHAACNGIRHLNAMGFNPKTRKLLEEGISPLFRKIAESPVNSTVAKQTFAPGMEGFGQMLALEKLLAKDFGLTVKGTDSTDALWKHLAGGQPALLDLEVGPGRTPPIQVYRGSGAKLVSFPIPVPQAAAKAHSVVAIAGFSTGQKDRKILILDSGLGTFAVWDYADVQKTFQNATLLLDKPE